MRGEGRVRRRRGSLTFAVLVLVGGCQAQDATPTSISPPMFTSTTAIPAPVTTIAAVPTTSAPPTTPSSGIGDPEAIAAAREEALRLIEMDPASFPPGAAEMDIPWPDTSNPDPVAALKSIWEFDEWVATTVPYHAFARMYLVEDSPAWSQAGEFITQLWVSGWIVVFDDPEGYVFEAGEIVDVEASVVPAEVVRSAGATVQVVRYKSSISSFRTQFEDGEPVSEFRGSDSVVRDALLVADPLGWRVVWFGPVVE